MKLIVADAGPLIIFGKTCGIGVIRAVVDEILVPPAVVAECTDQRGMPGAIAIRKAINDGWLTVLDAVPVSGAGQDLLLLDDGEKEAIAAAQTRQCPVLMDEAIGRSVAKKLGVQTIGSLGILLAAKQRGAIPAVAPIIEDWRAAHYFLGERLVAELLHRAGEA
jgi:predicted nucleic acid-binding protein